MFDRLIKGALLFTAGAAVGAAGAMWLMSDSGKENPTTGANACIMGAEEGEKDGTAKWREWQRRTVRTEYLEV